jgi:hypothetical protein
MSSETTISRKDFGRPALRRLEEEHDDLVAELRAGFDSLDGVIFWCQRLSMRTLGCLDDALYQQFGNERVLWSTLITSPEREKYGHDTVSLEAAEEFRLLVEATYVLPATRSAFRMLRGSAGEYFGDDEDGTVTVAGEQFIAMRPALNHLEDRQKETLTQLLDGIEGGKPELLDWLRDLNGATFGQIDSEFQVRAFKESRVTREVLLDEFDDPGAARKTRQLFAFEYLLPAFNAGVRKLVGKAGEDTAEEEEENDDRGAHIDV